MQIFDHLVHPFTFNISNNEKGHLPTEQRLNSKVTAIGLTIIGAIGTVFAALPLFAITTTSLSLGIVGFYVMTGYYKSQQEKNSNDSSPSINTSSVKTNNLSSTIKHPIYSPRATEPVYTSSYNPRPIESSSSWNTSSYYNSTISKPSIPAKKNNPNIDSLYDLEESSKPRLRDIYEDPRYKKQEAQLDRILEEAQSTRKAAERFDRHLNRRESIPSKSPDYVLQRNLQERDDYKETTPKHKTSEKTVLKKQAPEVIPQAKQQSSNTAEPAWLTSSMHFKVAAERDYFASLYRKVNGNFFDTLAHWTEKSDLDEKLKNGTLSITPNMPWTAFANEQLRKMNQ